MNEGQGGGMNGDYKEGGYGNEEDGEGIGQGAGKDGYGAMEGEG